MTKSTTPLRYQCEYSALHEQYIHCWDVWLLVDGVQDTWVYSKYQSDSHKPDQSLDDRCQEALKEHTKEWLAA